ncbi:MAG: hypothetical protein Q9219_003011 [cf. Caloplaca sp. 3 TL-2023]
MADPQPSGSPQATKKVKESNGNRNQSGTNGEPGSSLLEKRQKSIVKRLHRVSELTKDLWGVDSDAARKTMFGMIREMEKRLATAQQRAERDERRRRRAAMGSAKTTGRTIEVFSGNKVWKASERE